MFLSCCVFEDSYGSGKSVDREGIAEFHKNVSVPIVTSYHFAFQFMAWNFVKLLQSISPVVIGSVVYGRQSKIVRRLNISGRFDSEQPNCPGHLDQHPVQLGRICHHSLLLFDDDRNKNLWNCNTTFNDFEFSFLPIVFDRIIKFSSFIGYTCLRNVLDMTSLDASNYLQIGYWIYVSESWLWAA